METRKDKDLHKQNMTEDIFLSIACVISVIITYPITKSIGLFNTHTAADYITYSIAIVVVAKVTFHLIKFIYYKIKK